MAPNITPSTLLSSIFAGLLPVDDKGAPSPRAFASTIPFSKVASFVLDTVQEDIQARFTGLQSIFVDNADNGSPVTITIEGTLQRIVLAPQNQGIIPVFVSRNARITFASAGGVDITVYLLNIPLPYAVWATVAATIAIGVPTGAFIDRSGTIAAGGVSQILMAANANRKRYIIENPPDQVHNLFVNFAGAASAGGDSICVTPGNRIDSGAGPVSTQQIQVFGTTIAAKFVAKEM